jgi:hypothetical protein
MINKILVFFVIITLSACSSIKEKTGGLKKIGDTCPPKAERTLKDILCKEAK